MYPANAPPKPKSAVRRIDGLLAARLEASAMSVVGDSYGLVNNCARYADGG